MNTPHLGSRSKSNKFSASNALLIQGLFWFKDSLDVL